MRICVDTVLSRFLLASLSLSSSALRSASSSPSHAREQTKPRSRSVPSGGKKRTSSTTQSNSAHKASAKRSSSSSSSKPLSPDADAPSHAHELASAYLSEAQLSKAEKRTLRRKELLARQAQHAPDRTLPSAAYASPSELRASLPDHALSRSALRRRKRKNRDRLVGLDPAGGMDDLQQGLEAIQQDNLHLSAAAQDHQQGKIGALPPAPTGLTTADATTTGGDTPAPGHAAMTSKRRKAILAQESLRQKAILGDLTHTSNPWAALRQHANNSLAFDPHALRNDR